VGFVPLSSIAPMDRLASPSQPPVPSIEDPLPDFDEAEAVPARPTSFSDLSSDSFSLRQLPVPPVHDPCPDNGEWILREKSFSESTCDSWQSLSTNASESTSSSRSPEVSRKMAEQQKIIFLDVDGVLHAANYAKVSFDKPCMEALAYIQKETGAEIVLSSTWRLWEGKTGRDAVDKALKRFGIPKTVGQTPDLKGKAGRSEEIMQYVNRLKVPPHWIALDDMDMTTELGGRMILTPPKIGLTMKLARRAVAVLNDLPLEDECSDSDDSDEEDLSDDE